GFPAATLTKFGGGSLGGSVTDNNAGASVVLTGSGGTLTVNADGSLALTAPTTAGTYTFLSGIPHTQGSSDGNVTIQVNQARTITRPWAARRSMCLRPACCRTTRSAIRRRR